MLLVYKNGYFLTSLPTVSVIILFILAHISEKIFTGILIKISLIIVDAILQFALSSHLYFYLS